MGEIIKTWGPAWLVMIADVDAASAITAADSGAQYGTKLIWFLMLLVIPLYVIQEVAGRVGAVTSKGLGELIRENYSRRIAVLGGNTDGPGRYHKLYRRVYRDSGRLSDDGGISLDFCADCVFSSCDRGVQQKVCGGRKAVTYHLCYFCRCMDCGRFFDGATWD